MFRYMFGVHGTGAESHFLNDSVDQLSFRLGPWGIVGSVLFVILWALVATLLVLLIVYFIQQIRQRTSGHPGALPGQTAPSGAMTTPPAMAPTPLSPEALRLLDERYARGDMDHDDYAKRKSNLLAAQPLPAQPAVVQQPPLLAPQGAPPTPPGQTPAGPSVFPADSPPAASSPTVERPPAG